MYPHRENTADAYVSVLVLPPVVSNFASTHFISLLESSLPVHDVLTSHKTEWLTKYLHHSKRIIMSCPIEYLLKRPFMPATRVTQLFFLFCLELVYTYKECRDHLAGGFLSGSQT